MKPPEERYFISTPCKRGHSGRRYKSTGACVECMRLHRINRKQGGLVPANGQ